MILTREYREYDLRQVRLAFVSTTGQVSLGRGESLAKPNWILTKIGYDTISMQGEHQLCQELSQFVDLKEAASDKQPKPDAGKLFICRPKQ
jgi:hypothetical protein